MSEATIITGEAINLYQMRSQLSALGLEIRRGISFSRRSLNQHIRQQYGIKPRKKVAVWKELHKLCLEKEKELGIEPREPNETEKEILAM